MCTYKTNSVIDFEIECCFSHTKVTDRLIFKYKAISVLNKWLNDWFTNRNLLQLCKSDWMTDVQSDTCFSHAKATEWMVSKQKAASVIQKWLNDWFANINLLRRNRYRTKSRTDRGDCSQVRLTADAVFYLHNYSLLIDMDCFFICMYRYFGLIFKLLYDLILWNRRSSIMRYWGMQETLYLREWSNNITLSDHQRK